jgi:hypothetical protein
MYDGRVRGRVLDVLCADPLLVPTHASFDERHQDPFEPAAIDRSPGAPSSLFHYLKRGKKLKYRAAFALSASPRFYIDFDPKLPPKQWSLVFERSDAVAAACEPDMGWVHLSSHVRLPSDVPGDELQDVIDSCTDGHPVRWRDYGPRGLGMRTYIGPLLIEQLGRAQVLSLPVPVAELPWGGVRIDLCERPWEATREALHDGWTKAMHHLSGAQVFASYVVKPNGGIAWTRGAGLVNAGGRIQSP